MPPQTRCQKSKLMDPPPPTSRASFARLGPHHAQRRVEGGEIPCTPPRSRGATNAPESLKRPSAHKRARGNAGCPVHPQPRVRWGSKNCTRVFTAVAPEITRHPRTRMVLTASFVISPAIGFFVTVAGSVLTASLTPASRRQDHTT